MNFTNSNIKNEEKETFENSDSEKGPASELIDIAFITP